MFDITKSCELIDKNVGRRVAMKIQRMGSEKIDEINGTIRSKFSEEDSPFCKIETEAGKTEEVFLGEIVEMEILPE